MLKGALLLQDLPKTIRIPPSFYNTVHIINLHADHSTAVYVFPPKTLKKIEDFVNRIAQTGAHPGPYAVNLEFFMLVSGTGKNLDIFKLGMQYERSLREKTLKIRKEAFTLWRKEDTVQLLHGIYKNYARQQGTIEDLSVITLIGEVVEDDKDE